jgi:hypothetical protein
VKSNKGHAVIDKTGREIIPSGKYYDLHLIGEGMAKVTLDKVKWGIIKLD